MIPAGYSLLLQSMATGLKQLALLASGNGSNAENIVRYFRSHGGAEVCCILSNRPDAYVLERARQLGIESRVFGREDFSEGGKVLDYLQHKRTDAIILAGFLLKIPRVLIQAWPDRILNIHPALLPDYGGKGMYGMHVHEAVLRNGDEVSGITIHLVNEHYDEGRILRQVRCEVRSDDTPESLAARVHALEYLHYPLVIAEMLG